MITRFNGKNLLKNVESDEVAHSEVTFSHDL